MVRSVGRLDPLIGSLAGGAPPVPHPQGARGRHGTEPPAAPGGGGSGATSAMTKSLGVFKGEPLGDQSWRPCRAPRWFEAPAGVGRQSRGHSVSGLPWDGTHSGHYDFFNNAPAHL